MCMINACLQLTELVSTTEQLDNHWALRLYVAIVVDMPHLQKQIYLLTYSILRNIFIYKYANMYTV